MNIPGTKDTQRTAEEGLTSRLTVLNKTGSAIANETYQCTVAYRSYILTTDGTYTLAMKLPPVADCAGMLFFFYLVSDGGQNVTIIDYGDETDFDDATMADANDRCILMSDGVHWFCLDAGATTIS